MERAPFLYSLNNLRKRFLTEITLLDTFEESRDPEPA
jgi:hypothetical protein